MANTLQAAAVILVSAAAANCTLTREQAAWIDAIGADPAFVGDCDGADVLPEGEEPEMVAAWEKDAEKRAVVLHLAREVVEDRRMGSPVADHTHDLGPVTITTSLAAAVAACALRLEGAAFDRGVAYGRRHAG